MVIFAQRCEERLQCGRFFVSYVEIFLQKSLQKYLQIYEKVVYL